MYEQFRQKFKDFGVISTQEIEKVYPYFDLKNLVNWQKKGYLVKLRNKFYFFKDTHIEESFLYFIANKIYGPSYISMESALDYYGVIPEGVYNIQSITTRRTNKFKNTLGNFVFQTIKKDLFFGYQLVKKGNVTFKIALLEKVVLDFLYLRHDIEDIQSFESLRWNKEILKRLDEAVLQNYLELYDSPKMNIKVRNLKKYMYA